MRYCDGIYHQPMYVLALGGLEGLSSAQSTTRETLWQKFAETLSWVAERNSSHEFLRRLQLQDIDFRRWSLIIHVIICLLIRKLTHLSGQPNPICKRGWVMSGFSKRMPHHRVVSWHAHCV